MNGLIKSTLNQSFQEQKRHRVDLEFNNIMCEYSKKQNQSKRKIDVCNNYTKNLVSNDIRIQNDIPSLQVSVTYFQAQQVYKQRKSRKIRKNISLLDVSIGQTQKYDMPSCYSEESSVHDFEITKQTLTLQDIISETQNQVNARPTKFTRGFRK
eukprot:EST42564.1 Hypothetical protein SS50377_17879 [Spironucleus salmonicida]